MTYNGTHCPRIGTALQVGIALLAISFLLQLILSSASTEGLELLSDEQLRQRYGNPQAGDYHRVDESVLLEMARRGWTEFLRDELERLRSWGDIALIVVDEDGNEVIKEGGYASIEYLTALRRSQGVPDPIFVSIDASSKLDVEFLDSPVVVVQRTNVDTHSETLVSEWGDYEIKAKRVDGTEVEPVHHHWMGSRLIFFDAHEPGISIESTLRLDDYLVIDSPMEFEARLTYRARSDNKQHEPSEMIAFTSEPFQVRIRPRLLATTRDTLDLVDRWIDELDVSAPVIVLDEPLVGISIPDSATAPEWELMRLHYQALPALFSRLKELALDPDRRGWIFALLANITDLRSPNLQGAASRLEWVKPSWKINDEMFAPVCRVHEGPIVPSVQEDLTRWWLEVSKGFDVTIEEDN